MSAIPPWAMRPSTVYFPKRASLPSEAAISGDVVTRSTLAGRRLRHRRGRGHELGQRDLRVLDGLERGVDLAPIEEDPLAAGAEVDLQLAVGHADLAHLAGAGRTGAGDVAGDRGRPPLGREQASQPLDLRAL